MSATRLFSPARLVEHSELVLGDEQARYIGKALRLRPGDLLTLFDGHGGEFVATISVLQKTSISLNIGERNDIDRESPLHIHLLQGISRGERMDIVVQKATELGVRRITPVLSEFSVVKLDEKRAEKKRLHWQNIAISACEQCGRNGVPRIDPPIRLRNWFGNNLDAPGLRTILAPAAAGVLNRHDNDEKIHIVLIGPEGGFSDAEYEQAKVAGFCRSALRPANPANGNSSDCGHRDSAGTLRRSNLSHA